MLLSIALADRAGKVVRAWRITSRTGLGLQPSALTPTVAGGELVVQLDFSRRTGTQIRSEHLILGLRQTGGTYRHFSLDAHALCCDEAAAPTTPLRVASDGRLYQLRTNPTTGVTIARYSLVH